VDITEVPTYATLVEDVDLLLSILPPAEAENAAQRVATALRSTGAEIVYAECNAIAPVTTRRIEAVITDVGSQFVSASIIGPPPRREGTTRFYVSGSDVRVFETLAQYGLDVRPLGSKIEYAKNIKTSYGGLNKGLQAIAAELLVAAQKWGIYDALVNELQISQTNVYQAIERRLPRMPYRSRRWAGEMEEIAKALGALGLTEKIYQGAAEMYHYIGRTPLADETAENYDRNRTLAQVIEIIADESDETS
jgi:3-hydroxyisobutyrate dehydrogenase-like beta-hydroxyacid dehydrogenase